MRSLPDADPGTPDTRSAARYLWWLVRSQLPSVVYAMVMGIAWMVSMALLPYAIGHSIDAVTRQDTDALIQWAGAYLLLAVVMAITGLLRHRAAVYNWLAASFRTVQLSAAHSGRLGATLPKRLATGQVVAIGASDTSHIGHALDITARGSAAVVSLIMVTVILLSANLKLGLIVLLGVPIQMAIVSLLIKPLHRRQQAYREQEGALTGRATDIVAGLRVLRGVGGESVFSARYRTESQRLRDAGVRTGRVASLLEATQVLMPGTFLVLVTWVGARFAVAGEIKAYQLVEFYGYAAFLVWPLRTLAEALEKITRGHVSAGRVLNLLRLESEIADPARARELPSGGAVLTDFSSGLSLRPGVLTALAADRPEDAIEIAERLGRYSDGEVNLGDMPLNQATRADIRARIMVADNNARLFSGPLRAELAAGAQHPPTDSRLLDALQAASALDIIDALPDGLDSFVAERGREFSGGQQQRLRLARALLADRQILVLVEPTSAVDAHTEARIAQRLGAARVGRTTLITTTSPLVLDRADHVIFVRDGKVHAEGTHRELLARAPGYRALVTRGSDD